MFYEQQLYKKTESTHGKPTAVVTYYTLYIDKNGKKPYIRSVFFLDVTKEREIYDAFNIWFPIVFQPVYLGFPKGIDWRGWT